MYSKTYVLVNKKILLIIEKIIDKAGRIEKVNLCILYPHFNFEYFVFQFFSFFRAHCSFRLSWKLLSKYIYIVNVKKYLLLVRDLNYLSSIY